MGKRSIAALVLLLFIGGCTRSFEILNAVGGGEGAYMTFPRGERPREGDILRIVGVSAEEVK